MSGDRTNWAGNITFQAAHVHRPDSLDELRRIVAGSTRLRALGTAHSFNPIADSSGDQVSVVNLPSVLRVDRERSTVTVGGGVRYGDLAKYLHAEGYALHNLGSLPHISVAGACATGTHGSGVTNGSLASAVRALTLVTADGGMVTLERGVDADFDGAVVALGLLGVVTDLTLDIEPTYEVAQYVFEDLPLADVRANIDATFSAAYSVSLFTDWSGDLVNQIWLKYRTPVTAGEARWFEGRPADGPRHPVPGIPPLHCTEQLGVSGPWHERLPHFRLDFTPSNGDELQTEYFVARTSAADALGAVDEIRDLIAPVLQITELRTIAADNLWLSGSYQRDSVGIHFTWIPDMAAVTPVLAQIETKLAPFDARPHWGKVFTTAPDVVRSLYPRMADFAQLIERYDPAGMFGNEFTERLLRT
jgi:xylitol oxidase